MTALAVRHTRRTDDVAGHALERLDLAGEGVSGAGARMRVRAGVSVGVGRRSLKKCK